MNNGKLLIPVAVIDSGVNTTLFSALDKVHVTGRNMFLLPERTQQKTSTNKHGSTVCAIICKYMPLVHLFSVRIFPKDSLMTNAGALIRALNWCCYKGFPLINLSLGALDENDSTTIEQVIRKLIKNDQIIISAYSFFGNTVFPASLPDVIGVHTSPNLREFEYYPIYQGGKTDFIASSLHQLKKPSGGMVCTSLSTSYAVPTITAAFARAMADNFGLTGKRLIDYVIHNSN